MFIQGGQNKVHLCISGITTSNFTVRVIVDVAQQTGLFHNGLRLGVLAVFCFPAEFYDPTACYILFQHQLATTSSKTFTKGKQINSTKQLNRKQQNNNFYQNVVSIKRNVLKHKLHQSVRIFSYPIPILFMLEVI